MDRQGEQSVSNISGRKLNVLVQSYKDQRKLNAIEFPFNTSSKFTTARAKEMPVPFFASWLLVRE